MWSDSSEQHAYGLLDILLSNAILPLFCPDLLVGKSQVIEQDVKIDICASSHLSKTEVGNSETTPVCWAVRCLHKHLSGTQYHIVSDLKALICIFSLTVSVSSFYDPEMNFSFQRTQLYNWTYL